MTLNEPCTLESDGRRLRITQATLEPWKDGSLTRARSILQCTLGSKPPISICSLSKDFTFTQLDLELEESEQVIFAVKGPQVIHLSGYYVPPQAASKREASTSTDDLIIDCSGEADRVMAENHEERKLTVVERDIADTLLDFCQDSTPAIDYGLRDTLMNDKNLLFNADMHQDADGEMVNGQIQLLYAPDSIPDAKDEDNVPCWRKSTADGASGPSLQESDFGGSPPLPSIFVLPSCELELQKSLREEKKRIEGCGNEKKTADTEYQKNAIKDYEVHQAHKESDDVYQGCAGSQHCQKQFTTIESSGSFCLPSVAGLPCQIDRLNNGEKEKKSKEGCEKLKVIGAIVNHCRNALGENKISQAHKKCDDTCQGLAGNQHDQTSAKNIGQMGDSNPSLPPDEVHDAVNKKPNERLKNGNVELWPKTNDDRKQRNDNGLTFFSRENKCPNGSIPPPAEDRSKNGQNSKKRKKNWVLDQNYVNGGGDASKKGIFTNNVADMGSMRNCRDLLQESRKGNSKNLLNEANFKQKIEGHNIEGNENMEIVLPTNIGHQKPMDDTENHESHPDLVEDVYQSYKEFKKKKMQKVKAKQNGIDLCSASKARTISNGLIIEDLARGETGRKVAVPGRKVKVFYSVRLRETGSLIESNVGEEKPFKFCLGDKKVIQGWNLGIDGMRTGDRRRLIIPPSMSHGKRASDVIPPDSWLVYDIELVSVR